METADFSELGLSSKVFEAVAAAGYTQPTPIQPQAIPIAVTGQDVLGIAQTGTGKTAAFVLPMITRLEKGRARARMPRSLILAPTRELAAQVAEAFEKYGVNHKLNLALLIGGVSFDEQNRKLDRGVDVLIATPGRLLDHIRRGKMLLTGVEILVIDEADRMLDMGFIPDIEKICKLLPPRRQTLFFSATMPPEIQRLVDTFLNNPAKIEVARPATTAQTITQRFHFCPDGEDWTKREMLRDLINSQDVQNAIIFCNRKRDVAILLKSLIKHGYNAGALHGDMDQSNRMATLDKFRSGEITILAASDVAARGLDIPEVSHVFNFRCALGRRRLRPPHRPHRPRRAPWLRRHPRRTRRPQTIGRHCLSNRRQAGLGRRSTHRRRFRRRRQEAAWPRRSWRRQQCQHKQIRPTAPARSGSRTKQAATANEGTGEEKPATKSAAAKYSKRTPSQHQ